MNHPPKEKWMEWLYGETSTPETQQLQRHHGDCLECQNQVSEWRKSQALLNELETFQPRKTRVHSQPMVRWSAAAAGILLLGIAVGRWTTPGVDLKVLEARVADQTQALVQKQVQQLTKTHSEEIRALEARINRKIAQVQFENLDDLAALRKELETVALNTEAGFQGTQAQIFKLANSTPTPR